MTRMYPSAQKAEGYNFRRMEKLIREAQELFHIRLTGRQVMALVTYERELLDWNRKFNLTAI